MNFRVRTQHSCHKGNRVLGGEEGEEPWRSIEKWSDFMLLEVLVESGCKVVQQPRELVEADLEGGVGGWGGGIMPAGTKLRRPILMQAFVPP